MERSLAQLHDLHPPFARGPNGEAMDDYSGLTRGCTRLLGTPLKLSTPGDLRVMLHQRFYPQTLVPLALPLLEDDALLEGNRYPGDLLSATLYQANQFWAEHPTLKSRASSIAEKALLAPDLLEPVRADIEKFKMGTP